MSIKHLSTWWDSVRTSLWFVPTVCVAAAIIAAFIMPEVDHGLVDEGWELPVWIFAGSADGARSILSTIAGSLVTIVGVLFSITIVVLQQASTQFTPRVMGNFMRQTGVQLTLGIYLATFLYALLILRTVRGEDSQAAEFIPGLSITIAILMAAVSLGFLVYFIHHMATSLQASMVLANVNREFHDDVGPLYPEHIGHSAFDEDKSLDDFRRDYMPVPTIQIVAEQSGYLLRVDDDTIVQNAPETHGIAILPQIGDFIIRGTPIVEVGGMRELADEQRHNIVGCLVLGTERSRFQDPLFSIRQLVDIALKALSPSINDPTTANNAISMLGDCLALLGGREFPDRVRLVHRDEEDPRSDVHVWTNRPSFPDYVDAAFSEIRREATSHVAVTEYLIDTVGALGNSVTTPARRQPLQQILADVLRAINDAGFDERDEQHLREQINEAQKRLLAHVME